MSVVVETGSWLQLGSEAMRVRHAVFVLEQGVPPELEHDEEDARSLHALARNAAGEVLGTGRLLQDGHIGRLAVVAAARRKGTGRALMLCLLTAARDKGHTEALLNAQMDAVPFYRALGFEEDGSIFMEAGIPHVSMRKKLAA